MPQYKTVSQYDLPSFGLDPDAPIFIQQGYGPGGLPLNIYRGNSRWEEKNISPCAKNIECGVTTGATT